MVGAGRETLVTLRPRLLVVLAMLETAEVVLTAEVGATEEAAGEWSAAEFSTLACCKRREKETQTQIHTQRKRRGVKKQAKGSQGAKKLEASGGGRGGALTQPASSLWVAFR